jgi:hypothetical protein
MSHLPAFVATEPTRMHLRLQPKREPTQPTPPERVGRFTLNGPFTRGQRAVLERLEARFSDDQLRRVGDTIGHRTAGRQVSLRTLDWLVTNYSKKVMIRCVGADGAARDLHNAYRETLDFYGRPMFDPFRRGPRLSFAMDGVVCSSTLGQLAFFSRAIEVGILDYAVDHATVIEADRMAMQAHAKELRQGDSKRRRVELTPSNPTRIHVVRLEREGALPRACARPVG